MAGYYNRMDIYSLHVQRARPQPAYFRGDILESENGAFVDGDGKELTQGNGRSA
jgi:aliphatic nitrilase